MPLPISLAEVFSSDWARIPEAARARLGGALGSSRSLVVARHALEVGTPCLVVVPDQRTMEEFIEELEFFGLTPGEDFWEAVKNGSREIDPPVPAVFPFPHLETLPYENKAPEAHLKSDRLRVYDLLADLASDSPHYLKTSRAVFVAPVRSLLSRIADLRRIRSSQRVLRVGSELDRDEFAAFLLDEGYEAEELITDSGQFSVRGGIVDVFPFTATEPIRIELFGDEIDSIRSFDLLSQRSTRKLDHLIFGVADEIRQLLHTWKTNGALHGLGEFLPEGTRIFWDRPDLIQDEAERVHALAEKMFSQRTYFEEEGEIEEENPLLDIPPDSLYLDYPGLLREVESLDWVELSEFTLEEVDSEANRNLPIARPNLGGLDFKMKIQEILARHAKGEVFVLTCENLSQEERLKDLILDALEQTESPDARDSLRRAALQADAPAPEDYTFGKKSSRRKKRPFEVPGLEVARGMVRQGFHIESSRFSLVTDQEIFGRLRRIRTRKKQGMGAPIVDLVDLAPGQYVVHVDHGIGRFVGLKRITVGGREGEFLELRYEGEDVLYVPIEQIDRVTRYISGDDSPPKLSKMGSKIWQNAKARAKKAIEDLTERLLALYAAREVREGFCYPSDTSWQHEFEASFPFDETPDQWKAIGDVKTDMEAPRCMDRLVCGDVGFGKTEVAMRAAFKAVCSGKQVAVLAPTTVLVQQHYETFSERMSDYPVAIESVSRFRTPKEMKQVLGKAQEGDIDILIGTHRLLQKDVKFKDLGLVVVDEEQRFGVKHKERFKELRTHVDVLTLTATPIPRTLYMSMSGVRDMSLVNTPPKDRLPVETYVVEYKPEVVESAILRELARGGQVFFLHNRVESIYGFASMIQDIVPEAKVAVGHGQMEGHELEKVMHAFIAGEVDVLVSTTIIESGLDIPNANTILINRADTFGLAELYQLRGRVGRAHHQAYCYLLVPSKQGLSPVARQRLLAMQEHTALGSGFQIAMKDLEIRGMGNILGREQHGHIAAVGYDLYSSLLAKAIQRMRGEAMGEETSVVLDTYRSGEFPSTYVPSARQRMSIHKRMSQIETDEAIRSLREEVVDLYGKLPEEAERVFTNLELRQLSRKARVDHIRIRKDGAKIRLNESASKDFSPEWVVRLDRALPGRVRLSIQNRIYLEILKPEREDLWEISIAEVLMALKEQQKGG
jgi:transcription-repair coupling factor (superfamily II helicase)